MNSNTFLLIDGSLMLFCLPLMMILKGKKRLTKSSFNRESHTHNGSDIFFNGSGVIRTPAADPS